MTLEPSGIQAHRANCAANKKISMGIFMYGLHQPLLVSERRGSTTGGNTELGEDIADMPRHSLLADAQLNGNRSICFAAGYKLHDLHLAGSEDS